MDIGNISPNSEGEEGAQGKALVVILVGAPGSGKSTFCDQVIASSSRPWLRICQDTINNGKAGTKPQCLKAAANALKDGKSVFIDRCNLDKEQRAEFVKLGATNTTVDVDVDVHAVVLDLPAQLCISRSVKRTGHEGNLQGGKAAAVVNRMLQKKELPKLSEGFSRITFCQNESDVKGALRMYSELGPSGTLPHGSFGEKKPDAKVQLGIMKFLKKVDAPVKAVSSVPTTVDITPPILKGDDSRAKGPVDVLKLPGDADMEISDPKDLTVGSVGNNISLIDVPTLAFPSISTADFHFNLEKASDIIIEKVEEFISKLGNARLVLVDLSHGSKILSLVRAKAAQRNIDANKFFTFVGDITRLFSVGGLRCNVITNAANWRLKPGGGGVNASIFSAAGSVLEAETKKRAKSLSPGKAVVVPLPLTSPLFSREAVSHVIHVLGPNMNPQRPNCLNNDYIEGCKILGEAYASLFEGFVSIMRIQSNSSKEVSENLQSGPSVLHGVFGDSSKEYALNSDQKPKRERGLELEKSKKCKGSHNTSVEESTQCRAVKENVDENKKKAWGTWAQALYHSAMHPERHKDKMLEISDDVVVLNDMYPKAQRHLLVLARLEGLDCLADVQKEHLQLLRTMHDVGLKWAEKLLQEDPSLIFRLGYHSTPSMRQLHLHVISQDFSSKHLKNKKHWNSFNTVFFCDSVDVLEEVSSCGKATIKDDEGLLSMELRCHRCRSAHPNIPRLKSHISSCRSSFPAAMLQNGRLVESSNKV